MAKLETWMGIDAGYGMPGLALAKVNTDDRGYCQPGEFIHAEGFVCPMKIGAKNKRIFKKLTQTKKDCLVIQDTTVRILELIKLHKPSKIIVELPTGGAKSSSAIKGMAMATAMTIATLETLSYVYRDGFPWGTNQIVTITPMDNKKGSTNVKKWAAADHDESKWLVWQAVNKVWLTVPWPKMKIKKDEYEPLHCWAMADALSCILTHIKDLNEHLPLI